MVRCTDTVRSALRTPAWLYIAVLVVLFCAAGFVESVQQHSLNSIANGDFWWHLRVGTGILQNHALPHTGAFSQFASQPWTATSWLYEVVVALAYRVFDLNVAAWTAIAFKIALAVVTFLLAGGLRGRFWAAVSLSAIAQYILFRFPPLPAYCSMLLFAVELLLLFQSRTTRSLRPLYWLPAVFLLWANLDAQFVVGIIVLLLFVIVLTLVPSSVISREERSDDSRACPELVEGDLHFVPLLGITAASLIATILTPYGWNSYGVFFARLTSAANSYFPGYSSLRFRTPQDYALLLLVMSAFLALGMRRSRDLFQIALLLLCAFASFRAQRDLWLATLAAVAVVAESWSHEVSAEHRDDAENPEKLRVPRASVVNPQFLVAIGIACLLLGIAGVLHLPRGHKAMLAEIGEGYPVAAADYIREHNLPQPLFNSLPWGGFLAWYLPEYSVAIDGRTDLYGDDFNTQYGKVMNAEAHFSTLPAFGQAATLLLEKHSLLGKALPSVPAFEVAYSDNVAVVLIREQPAP